jgi:hypothetical protein
MVIARASVKMNEETLSLNPGIRAISSGFLVEAGGP